MNGTRVLLADDNPAMLGKVAELLRDQFHVVGAVTDGQAALDAVNAMQPEVLVLDISMPVLNGVQTAQRLQQIGSSAKLVFLTMHDDPDYVREALATGALGYVIKSRLASDLVVAIQEALAGRSFISPSLSFADAS